MLHFNIALHHLFSLGSRIVSLPASAFNLRTAETFFFFFFMCVFALKLYLVLCFANMSSGTYYSLFLFLGQLNSRLWG